MERIAHILRLGAALRRARGAELRFAVRAWALAPLVEGSIALLGVRRTIEWTTWLASPRARSRPDAVPVGAGARWVDRAYAIHAVRGLCLPRAIIQHSLHRADGVESRLVIGVRRAAPGNLDAHAWVEAVGASPQREFEPILVAVGGRITSPESPS